MDCSPRIDAVSAARATGESADLAALPATGWEPVSLPDHWSQRWPNFTGTVWYRIDWARPCSANGDDRVPLGIVVEHLNMAGAVFINRELLWRDPSLVEPLSRSWNTPRFFPLGFSVLRTDHNELLIQVVGASDFSSGLGSVTISSAKDAAALYEKRMLLSRTLPGINVVISGTLGAFFLALWLMRRQDAAYGWYALTSATWVLFLSNTLVTSPWPFGTTDSWSRWITVSMVFFCVALCRFLWAFGGQRFPRLARALWIGSGLVALLFLLMPQSWFASATLVAFLTCVLIFVAICLQFIVRAVHTRTTEHLLLAACLLGFLVAGLHDAMLLLRILPANPAFTPVTAPLITIGMSLILASRFARSLKQVESFKVELEGQVRLARDDLVRTLTREHQLEIDNVRLSERLQLAHDLHDGLGSSLVRSIALVELSGQVIKTNQYLSMFKSLRDDLRQVIDTSSASTVMADTPQQWLAPTRHRYGELFDELGIAGEWQVPALWPSPLSAKQLLGLTRILEEALTNVIKHSRCTWLRVSISTCVHGGIQLDVEDNGVGFDAVVVSESMLGIGLRSMRARAGRIGGSLQIVSSREGSRIHVKIGAASQAA